MKSQLIILFFFFASISISYSQSPVNITRSINENKGTFVTREIKGNNKIDQDSSQLLIRVFYYFGKLGKGGPNSIKTIWIDSEKFSPDENGELRTNLKKGWHSIGIQPFDKDGFYNDRPSFSPFKAILLKFKKRKYYSIDIYLPSIIAFSH